MVKVLSWCNYYRVPISKMDPWISINTSARSSKIKHGNRRSLLCMSLTRNYSFKNLNECYKHQMHMCVNMDILIYVEIDSGLLKSLKYFCTNYCCPKKIVNVSSKRSFSIYAFCRNITRENWQFVLNLKIYTLQILWLNIEKKFKWKIIEEKSKKIHMRLKFTFIDKIKNYLYLSRYNYRVVLKINQEFT